MLDNFDPQKGSDVFLTSEWITYVWVLVISIWGGMAKYFGSERKFSWKSLVAQIISSSFAGMITLFACQYSGITGPLVGALAGLAGHLGTPALISLAMRLKAVKALLVEEPKK